MLRFVALVAVCVKLAGSQQCIPVTEMACNSGWSDYTTCIAHDKEMMEGIASYKDQVAQMGCEVPPWYWQATVESKMMRNRAGLMQYRESHNLGPMETVLRMPKMSRRKRDVDYEDDTNYVYQQVDTNNQVSAGCGFCARRIRCCKDFHQSWIDQNMESEVCEEYSDACQVPPMEDGTCDYALAMPKLINDHMDQVPGNNTVIGGRLESRLRDKWMSLLGATEPTMSCTKNGNVCHCCCGNYTAEPTEQGAMVCRRRRGPTGCGPNEVYEECSTSCQATCMEPNPSCAGEECKTIHAGCKCKPGMVRSGVKCIPADQCPPITGNDAMRVQFKADANFAEVVTAEGTTQVTQRWTNQVASATKVDPTRINDVTLTPGSVVVEFTVSSGKPNEPTSQEVADNLQQLVQQNSLPLTDKNGNKLQIVQSSFKNLGSVSPPGTSTPVQPATTTTQGSEATGSDSTGSAGTGASDRPVTTTVAGATTTAAGATTTTQESESTGSDSTGSAGTGASDTPVTTTVAGATTTTQESESTGSDSTGSAGTGASDTPVTTTVAGATTTVVGATTTSQESEFTGSDSTGSAGTGASDTPVTTTVAGATTTTQGSEGLTGGSDSTGSAGTGASDTPVTTTVAGATTTVVGATTTTEGSEGLTGGSDSTGSAGTGASDTPVTTTVAGATTKAPAATTTKQESESTGSDSTGSAGTGASDTPVTTTVAGATTTTQESESTGSDSTGSAGTGASDTPATTTVAGATTKAPAATTTTQESESTGSDSTGSAGTGASDTPVTTTVAGATTTVVGATTTTEGSEGLTGGSDSTGSAGTGSSDTPVTTTVAGATTTVVGAITTTQESEFTGSDSTGSAGTGASDTPVTTTVAGATTTTQGSEGLTGGSDSTGSAGTESSDTPITTTVLGAKTTVAGATTSSASDIPSGTVTESSGGTGGTSDGSPAAGDTGSTASLSSDGSASASTASTNCMLSWSSPSQCTTACNYDLTVTAPDPDNSTSILLELTAVGLTGDFWTGIGWSPKGKMQGSDATLIIVKNGVVSVEDRSMGDHQLKGLDTNQNAFLMTGSVNDGMVKAKVRITCKQNDDSLNICKDQFYPLYAAAPSALNGGEPGYHSTRPIVGDQFSFATCF